MVSFLSIMLLHSMVLYHMEKRQIVTSLLINILSDIKIIQNVQVSVCSSMQLGRFGGIQESVND